jgi:hypothetical protein
MGSIIHCDQQPVSTRTLPGERQEAIPGPVIFPSRRTLKQLPLALANGGLAQYGKQASVKLVQLPVDGFFRTAAKMRGDAFPSSLKLPLMEETETRGEEGNGGRSSVDLRRKRGGRARLVVVFDKAG